MPGSIIKMLTNRAMGGFQSAEEDPVPIPDTPPIDQFIKFIDAEVMLLCKCAYGLTEDFPPTFGPVYENGEETISFLLRPAVS